MQEGKAQTGAYPVGPKKTGETRSGERICDGPPASKIEVSRKTTKSGEKKHTKRKLERGTMVCLKIRSERERVKGFGRGARGFRKREQGRKNEHNPRPGPDSVKREKATARTPDVNERRQAMETRRKPNAAVREKRNRQIGQWRTSYTDICKEKSGIGSEQSKKEGNSNPQGP